MSEPDSDFTNERPPRDQDVTGQPARPAYDYGPDSDDDAAPSIRKSSGVSLARATGRLVVGLMAGFSALVIFMIAVCSR